MQFSKIYTKVVEIPVAYVNEPKDKIILDENPDHIDVRITDTGFAIMYYQLFTPTLDVDLQEATLQENRLLYSINKNSDEIAEQLMLNYGKSEVLQDVIAINYYQKMVKEVPVVSNITVDYAAGYSSPNEVQLEPDTITVSGHDQVIDTLQAVRTKEVELKGINASVQGEVAIDKTSLEGVSLYTEKVDYFLEVEKFTEGRVTVPIEVVNVPKDVEISIFPQEVIVIFQVNLDDYQKVSANDFRVVCDYNNIEEDMDFLIPEITTKPDVVKNARLNEKKVEFVIKR